MNKIAKTLTIISLLALATPALAQISIDIHLGPPPARREVRVAAPFPGAVWIAGYNRYDPGGRQYVWVPGEWQRPPRDNAVWVKPRYVRKADHYDYYEGKWGDRPNAAKNKGQAKKQNKQGRGNSGKGR